MCVRSFSTTNVRVAGKSQLVNDTRISSKLPIFCVFIFMNEGKQSVKLYRQPSNQKSHSMPFICVMAELFAARHWKILIPINQKQVPDN